VEGTDFIQWAIGQGIAVAVLAFVLVRLEARMSAMQETLTRLAGTLDALLAVLGKLE